MGDPGRRPDRIRPCGGPQTGPARRLPDAHRQAGGPGRADRRRRQPGLPDRHEHRAPWRASMMAIPLHILIVDDAADNTSMLQALLKPEGYLVRTAADGPAA